MSCSLCALSREALAEKLLDEDPALDQACASCKQRLAPMTHAAAMLAHTDVDVVTADARRSMIERARLAANARGATHKRSSARSPWVRFAPVLAAAAVLALLVGGFVRSKRSMQGEPALVAFDEGAALLDGHMTAGSTALTTAAAIPKDADLVVPEGTSAKLRLQDGTEVTATSGTNFRLAREETRFQLQQGSLGLAVQPRTKDRPLHVETPELALRVVGTAFTVARLGSRTDVRVTEGLVEIVAKQSGHRSQLGPGTTLSIGGHPKEPAAEAPSVIPPEPAPSVDAQPEADASAQVATAAPRMADIRARVRAGKLAEARQLLQRAKTHPAYGHQAEIAVVEAELYLAERQYAQAIDAYLHAHRAYRSSPQGEEALFAAAQLALDHQGAPRARALLEQYLKAYPQGRFREDARRLLESTAPKP